MSKKPPPYPDAQAIGRVLSEALRFVRILASYDCADDCDRLALADADACGPCEARRWLAKVKR